MFKFLSLQLAIIGIGLGLAGSWCGPVILVCGIAMVALPKVK